MPAKRRIKIPEIVRDIRSRITDSELMEKYKLSAKGLESLFKTILDAGIMQSSEIYERLPSYDHSVDLEDLRSQPRRDLELRIHLFDQTQPQVRGLLSDLTEKGFRVREVEAKVAEVRTFVIPADELFPIDPIVLETRCRWVMKEAGGSSVAGFEITDVSKGNLGELLSLIRSSTREGRGRSDVNRFIDDGEDTTETVDLTSVFTENVTDSGSFSFTGVKRTWFGKLIQALPVPALLIDQSYKITFANQSWTTLGGNYKKLEGKPFSCLFPNPWVADEAESVAEKVFSTRKRGTGQALLQIDKSKTFGRLHFRSVRMGTARSLLILVEDLTPEKEQLLAEQKHTEELSREIIRRIQAEQDLWHEKQKFEFVSEYAPVGMVMIGENGEFQYINRKFKELFGYEPTEIPTGRDWFKKAYPDPQYRHDAISSWIEGFKKSEPGEALAKLFTVKCKDGKEKITRFRATKLDTGQYVMTCEDVTERTRLEEQLREAQKMEAVGTLASGIAHDFNNMLQIISGYAEMLLADTEESATGHQDLRAICQAAQRGANLVKRILTFSRKVETEFKPTDLNHEVKEVRKLLSRTIPKMIDIDMRLADDLTRINADRSQVEQILINLAVNAKDAMSAGGKLVIGTKNVTLDQEYCRTCHEVLFGDYVQLAVSDTGHGMEKHVLERIFEPFFTTKKPGEGTGLGLPMVFGIVKMHNGHITCHSEPGSGATFNVYFPIIACEVEAEVSEEPSGPVGGSETILVVDDEELISELAKKLLSRSGYCVLTAGSGPEAIALYKKERANISLVILDLIMPDMGGRQCLEELLRVDPQVKALIASGFAVDGETKGFLDEKARGMVTKPFKVGALLQSVRHALDRT